jgi:predicted nucleotidyltransferase component of viral defense system
MKLLAFENRVKACDLYDIAFIVENFKDEIEDTHLQKIEKITDNLERLIEFKKDFDNDVLLKGKFYQVLDRLDKCFTQNIDIEEIFPCNSKRMKNG